jgi:Na+-transporting NADH:ubiquinone oxidoreductase subunit B
MLRNLLDKLEPNFHKGGKWESWYALYEAVDTALFKPSDVTKNSSHVRDSIDLKRVMITVWMATFPTMFFGMWNVGFQANSIMLEMGMAAQEGGRGIFIAMLAGYDPTSIWDNLVHGAAYFLPIYMVTFIVGGFWEVLFARVRGPEVNEG